MTSSTYRKAIDQIKSVPKELHWHLLEFVRVLSGSKTHSAVSQPLSVRGIYKDGKIELPEAMQRRNEQTVIVTFLETENEHDADEGTDWDALNQIIDDCQIDTGITDLAHQHDHYIHGTPKHSL